MGSEVNYQISNVFNIFSSNSLDMIKEKYHLGECYCLNQIHSVKVLDVDSKYINNSNGDAMITKLVNTPLVIRTADCIPIVLYDNVEKVLAVVHAGWKGTLNNIVSKVINKMVNEYNCKTKDIMGYIYPAIRKCHFEVDDDVYSIFKNKISNIDKYTSKNGIKYYIDLVSMVKDNLYELGIKDISDMNICTYCNNHKFYSYRYNRTSDRNYLIAMIER